MTYVDMNTPFEFTTDNQYWIDRVIADAKLHPDEIKILAMPSENDGSIRVMIPTKYMEIRPEQIKTWQEEENGKA